MNTKKLKELAALAAIQNQVQGPQLEQQQEERRGRQGQLESVLGLLGLLNQQERNTQAAQTDTAHLGIEKDRLKNEQTHYQDEAQRFKDSAANSHLDHLSALLPYFGQMDPVAREAAMSAFPELQGAGQKVHEAETKKQIGALTGQLTGAYQTGAKDLPKLNNALGALQPSVPEEVWNGVDWNTLNAMLPGKPPVSQFTPPPRAPLGGGPGSAGARVPLSFWEQLMGPSPSPTPMPRTGGGKASAGPKRPLNY